MNQIQFTMSITIICILLIGCDILPKNCPDNELLGNKSLKNESLKYYPDEISNKLIFKDQNDNIQTSEVIETIEEREIQHEILCSEEIDFQYSYYDCEVRELQYKIDQEQFYVELRVWKDVYGDYGSYDDEFNDVLVIYKEEEKYEPFRFKIITSTRGNSKQKESEYSYHEKISLNGKTFSNIYETVHDGGSTYYYSSELGVVAFKATGQLWVLN